jgi:hypothetical protein
MFSSRPGRKEHHASKNRHAGPVKYSTSFAADRTSMPLPKSGHPLYHVLNPLLGSYGPHPVHPSRSAQRGQREGRLYHEPAAAPSTPVPRPRCVAAAAGRHGRMKRWATRRPFKGDGQGNPDFALAWNVQPPRGCGRGQRTTARPRRHASSGGIGALGACPATRRVLAQPGGGMWSSYIPAIRAMALLVRQEQPGIPQPSGRRRTAPRQVGSRPRRCMCVRPNVCVARSVHRQMPMSQRRLVIARAWRWGATGGPKRFCNGAMGNGITPLPLGYRWRPERLFEGRALAWRLE